MRFHWSIVAILAAVIVLLLLFQPSTPPNTSREDAYRQHIGELRVDSARSAARIDSLVKVHVVRTVKDSIDLRAKETVIKRLSTRLTQTRPQVQPILDTIPILKRFVETQDSLIQTQDSTILMLQQSLYDAGKEFSGLLEQVAIDKRISSQMISACELNMEQQRQDFEKKEKKLRRTSKLLKVAAVVSFGLGVLLAK